MSRARSSLPTATCYYNLLRSTTTRTMVSVGPIRSAAPSTDSSAPKEELFDLLTADDQPLHQTKARSLVHRDGDWHCAIHIWVIHPVTGKLLVQQRSATKDSHPSCWDVSCAGHLSAGETSDQAAQAEIGEELGIEHSEVVRLPVNGGNVTQSILQHYKQHQHTATSSPTYLYHLCRLKREQISQQGKFIDREHTDVYLAIVNQSEDEYTLQAEEVDRVKYMDVEEFVDIQSDSSKAEQLKYVAMSEFDVYHQRVFRTVQAVRDQLLAKR